MDNCALRNYDYCLRIRIIEVKEALRKIRLGTVDRYSYWSLEYLGDKGRWLTNLSIIYRKVRNILDQLRISI